MAAPASGTLVSVTVDTNAGETPLYTALEARLGAGHHMARQRLDVGDLVMRKMDGDGRAIGTVLIERKSWPDLAKSLADGRWHEQKARLVAAAAGVAGAEASDETDGASDACAAHVLYVVEGAMRGWTGTVGGGAGGAMGAVGATRNAQLEAAILMTAVRDGVPVLRTKDAAHTVETIAYLHAKLCETDELTGGAAPVSAGSYAALVKHKRKRDNLTPAVTWAVMLAAVPGMSARKAEAVAAAYPTMAALAAATEADLAAVRVPPAGGPSGASGASGRRLGPAVAKRLVALQ